MKEVILSRGKVALIDDEDFEYLNQWKWFVYHKTNRNTGYAVREIRHIDGGRSLVRMHRQLMNAQKGQIIDHIDGDGFNNQKNNLRFCSDTQNKYNSCIRRHNTSGYKGVSWSKSNKKWLANIRYDNKYYYIGSFITKEEAALAYNDAALKYHGEFARLNIINGPSTPMG